MRHTLNRVWKGLRMALGLGYQCPSDCNGNTLAKAMWDLLPSHEENMIQYTQQVRQEASNWSESSLSGRRVKGLTAFGPCACAEAGTY
jgi:hypothetical protein